MIKDNLWLIFYLQLKINIYDLYLVNAQLHQLCQCSKIRHNMMYVKQVKHNVIKVRWIDNVYINIIIMFKNRSFNINIYRLYHIVFCFYIWCSRIDQLTLTHLALSCCFLFLHMMFKNRSVNITLIILIIMLLTHLTSSYCFLIHIYCVQK